jgi:hypothetical protein
VTDFDDLDALERELGPSLRVALRRAAAEITEEQLSQAPWLSRNGPGAAGARFDDAARDLEVLEPEGFEVMMAVDFEPTPEQRWGVRRSLVVAAAAAALALIAGSVLVWSAVDDDVDTRVPAGTSSTSSTVSPNAAFGNVLPPEGAAPSTPETGELVASIAFTRFGNVPAWHDKAINLYADGRVIWATSDVPRGIAEQRLTAKSVERVRDEFLSTALFAAGQSPDASALSCVCIIRVRDGDRLLSTPFGHGPPFDREVDRDVDREVDRLVEFFTNLESALPPSAWEDREITPYVASHYRFCMWKAGANPGFGQPVSDRSNVLAQLLPPRVVELLDEQGWVHRRFDDCVDLTIADAHVLAEWLSGSGQFHDRQIDDPDSTYIQSFWQPLLPDGPAFMAPG